MNDLVKKQQGALSTLEAVTMDIQYHIKAAGSSMLRIGEGLIEAKKLVPHGQWLSYLRDNFGWEERNAQYFMQMYTRFGEMEGIEGIGKSKLMKMLSLPEGTEQAFIEKHDVEHMTVKEVGEAVKEARGGEKEREEAPEPQQRDEQGIPEAIADRLRELERENQRLADQNKEIIDNNNALRSRNSDLQGMIDEQKDTMQGMQDAYNALQQQITDMRSDEARGDADRTPTDELTPQAFAAAVRQFVGACAIMPQMGRRFAAMAANEYNSYAEAMDTLQTWFDGARRAMQMITGEVLDL